MFEARRLDLCQVPARFVRLLALVRRRRLRRVQLLPLTQPGYPLVDEGWRLRVDRELVKCVQPVRAGEHHR